MKKLIVMISLLIILLIANFSANAAPDKNKQKAKKELSANNKKSKTPAKHKFFIHFINIVAGNEKYA